MSGLNTAVALAYLLAALVRLELFKAVPVWPAAGVALAAALLMGDRAWRGIFLGSLLSSMVWAPANGVQLFTLSNLSTTVQVAAGHALAAVAGGRALRRVIGSRKPFDSPLDALRFCVWGVGTYALVSFVVGGTASQLWSTPGTASEWIVGDLVGVLVVTPVLLVWRQAPPLLLRRADAPEVIIVILMALGVMAGLYSPIYRSVPPALPVAALLAFPLFWAAMRLDQRICVSLTAACCLVSWWGTAAGHGPLVEVAGRIPALARAARFSGILAILLLVVSAMYTERKLAEATLRESEARLRLALTTGRMGAWDWNLLSGAITWSEGHFTLLGLDRTAVQPSYQAWAERVHPEDLARVEALMQRARAERTPYSTDYRVVRPDGSMHWVEARGQYLYSDDGLPVRMMAAMADVTERKQAEAALQEADRQKDDFLAMLAHELRNPLAPIRNAVELLRLIGPNEPRFVRAGDIIDRQVTHLVRLVDDLLDISRVTSGKILLRKERVDLSAMVQQALEAARPLIDRKGHTLTLALCPEPIAVDADPARLVQVIANLLINAAKFTAELGQIALTTERRGELAVIRVQDTGVGIAPELLARVFDIFVQGATSLDRAEGGLGIGLPLVHRIVEMHGGHVTARSAGVGHGSEFIVTWPALPPGPPVEPGGAAVEPRAANSPLRILVVEDNVDATESFVSLLELRGHEVRSAGNGLAALELAQLFLPDVAFIDLGLPGLDGYETARRLRQQPAFRTTLLVAVSGYGRDEDKRRAREVGFDHHLTKPVDPSAIEALLAERAAGAAAPSHSSSVH